MIFPSNGRDKDTQKIYFCEIQHENIKIDQLIKIEYIAGS